MKALTLYEYERLVGEARTVARDPREGIKVLRFPDETFLKLFRRKRLLSSSRLRPYVRRFCRNARRLRAMRIPTIEVVDAFRIRGTARDAVRYRGLEGISLRAKLGALQDRPQEVEALLIRYAAFLAFLHRKGIYFRAIHFNNVFLLPDGSMGLIDIADMRFSRGPLRVSRRARNFKPPFRYEEDRTALERFGIRRFVDRYLENADLNAAQVSRFLRILVRQRPELEAAIERLSETPQAVAPG